MTGRGTTQAHAPDMGEHLCRDGVLAPGDLAAVELVAERFGERDPQVRLALALAIRAPRVGHAGVDLARVREQVEAELALGGAAEDDAARPWPDDPAAWLARVAESPLVTPLPVGEDLAADAPVRPFVVQRRRGGGALVLTRRMFREQAKVAAAVRHLLATAPAFAPGEATVDAALARLFRDEPAGEGAAAVRSAVGGRLAVITGGPGTGKTFSVGRLLALLLEAAPDGPASLRVALAAPTGKAAVRMTEGLAEALGDLSGLTDPDVARILGELPASTLHRLLGVRPDGTSRHGPTRPVPADVVVVDEASMIDLASMARLLGALAPGARLVLLGDPDQLASVEAGTVLADLTAPGVLPDSAHVAFTHSRRFEDAPTVAAVAAAIQARAPERAVALMVGRAAAPGEELPDRVRHLETTGEGALPQAHLDELARPYLEAGGYAGELCALLRQGKPWPAEAPADLLRALDRYRVLAAHRRGPRGVEGLQDALAERVRAAVTRAAGSARVRHGAHWLGQVILVTRNAYDVDLRNGDVGLVLPAAGGTLAAFFPDREGPRELALTRLPPHVGGLAMTVHKSQGSQFDRVALVLPARPSPLLTRELVYTAVTRARRRVDWYGSEGVLAGALARPIQRASGLPDLLLGPAGDAG